MLYLADANVFIDAHRDYYPIKSVPEFWEWLIKNASKDRAKLTMEIYRELETGDDELSNWVRNNEQILLLNEEVGSDLVRQVAMQYLGASFDDEDIVNLRADPLLIAAAMVDKQERVVVTSEKSKPSAQGENRKIPDVCEDLGVRCINPFEFNRELRFRTSRGN